MKSVGRLIAVGITSAVIAGGACWGDGEILGPAELTGRVSGELGVASTEQKGIIIELPDSRQRRALSPTHPRCGK